MPMDAIRQALLRRRPTGTAEPEPEPQPGPQPEPEPEPQPGPQPESEPEPELQPEPPTGVQVPAVAHVWDLGHFYSPVPDTRELSREPTRSRVWPAEPRETPGLEWRGDAQLALLRELAEQRPMTFPSGDTGDPADYHTANPNFSALDAWGLQGMLRHLRPVRVLEVGCGWSSLVTARVNREHFEGRMDVTCVEPYPPEFIAGGLPGVSRLLDVPVQDVPLEAFLALGDGDVLFIDTSHVIKTGNDVQYLYHEVVPRLNPGVAVHIHDIFLPFDYPEDWVMGGRGWNEQYLVQSFLAFNREFEILLGLAWLSAHHRQALRDAAGAAADVRGGSLWIRRRPG